MGLYVEARIRAGIDEVWDRSQLPDRHQRWDLRFTEIDYLPCAPGEPQRFRYATRVLPLLTVDGTGVSAGERNRPDGTRTSALRFSSAHPLSLIEEGRGYWRYIPDGEELRFLTGYDYRPRWGRFGRLVDALLFRPLMGWATAWSFDRLRLWCERGISPERSLCHALAELAARIAAVVAAAIATAALAPLAPLAVLAVTVLAVTAAALLLPPLPVTPAARRCLRRPPERAAGRSGSTAAPTALLATLEHS
ncbi:hypothetical protein [Streptomyces tubercidicus]|uniref:hypothetical protein n=1 Tax=Streptomyces tubercidicus TaxID=47759 RepID=UPI002E145283|nr:hypothetical protein OG761_12595 [Streptomyces tubercidicus]WSX22661.1 hypothetical protein OG690_24420 [Streptomyces tubercidicus]